MARILSKSVVEDQRAVAVFKVREIGVSAMVNASTGFMYLKPRTKNHYLKLS